jgi:hypothetical protein
MVAGGVLNTLICLKPTLSNRSLADRTAWNAGRRVNRAKQAHDVESIRVGEALTKERKSSAALSEGLEAMLLC